MTSAIKILIGILVLAVILIAGWWVWKSYLKPQLQPSVMPTPPQFTEGKVTLTTDKSEYETGEEVRITLRNGWDIPIFYLKGFKHCSNKPYRVYKLNDEDWQDITPPSPCLTILEAGKPVFEQLNSYSSAEFIWDSRVYDKDTNDEKKAFPGTYRFSVEYRGFITATKTPKTIYSNEFRIK